MQITVWVFVLIKLDKVPGFQHAVNQLLVLFGTAGTPMDMIGTGQRTDFFNPLFQNLVLVQYIRL